MKIKISPLRLIDPDSRGYLNTLAVRIDHPTDETLSILRRINGVEEVSRLSENNFVVYPYPGYDLEFVKLAIRVEFVLY